MIKFKIRRLSDGLFSTGGRVPDWNAHGKEWKTVGALKSAVKCHQNHVEKHNSNKWRTSLVQDDYKVGCELVKITYAVVATSTIPI